MQHNLRLHTATLIHKAEGFFDSRTIHFLFLSVNNSYYPAHRHHLVMICKSVYKVYVSKKIWAGLLVKSLLKGR